MYGKATESFSRSIFTWQIFMVLGGIDSVATAIRFVFIEKASSSNESTFLVRSVIKACV